jgi:hypothetical protein
MIYSYVAKDILQNNTIVCHGVLAAGSVLQTLFFSVFLTRHICQSTHSLNHILPVDSKGFDDGVQHSELLGFWSLSIVRYSKN